MIRAPRDQREEDERRQISGAWEAGLLSLLPRSRLIRLTGYRGEGAPEILSIQPSRGDDQRGRLRCVHVCSGRVPHSCPPTGSRPLTAVQRTGPASRRPLPWAPKPGLWEQSDLISNEESASYCPCDAGQVPYSLWPSTSNIIMLQFPSIVEIDES